MTPIALKKTITGPRTATALLLMLVLCQTACRPADEGQSSGGEPQPPLRATTVRQDSGQEPTSGKAANFPRENWDVLFMEGTKIGHGWTHFEKINEDGRDVIHVKSEQLMSVKRFEQQIKQQVILESWELPDGQVLRFSSEMNDGGMAIKSRGRYAKGKLQVETETLGKTITASLDWDPSWGGFFSAEQHLEEKPMRPGEKRSYRALMPIFNQVAQLELSAADYESTPLLSGESQQLLRINEVIRLGSNKLESITWTDREGRTLKTQLVGLDQVSYRATKEEALAPAQQAGKFDLGRSSVVKVDRSLPQPHATRKIVYRAQLPNGDPLEHFTTGATQSVRRIDAHVAEITVRALRPSNQADEFPRDIPPGVAETEPNNFLQSDHPDVLSMAKSVAPEEKDPWRLACDLERHVRDAVHTKDFSQAVATAADVARSREGDCTEHAVLLAALCRARGIPARIAIGLVYFAPAGGFAYHMWTEVWIGHNWIPLDGTLGQGGIGAAHLKITQSNLQGTDSLLAFLPVFKLLGQLQLQLVSVEESNESRIETEPGRPTGGR